MTHRLWKTAAFAALSIAAASPALARGPDLWNSGVAFWSNDPPGRVFPGKYFEYKAQFYLRKGDAAEALRLFELAGYWGNKVAQYNAGIMHYKGLGAPEDRILGTAWLGVAAERHDDLADAALQNAYAGLGETERQQADSEFRQLDAKYGDAVSIPRALHQYVSEARGVTGSHAGFGGNVMIAEAGTDRGLQPVSEFYSLKRADLDELIGRITGHVTVGSVQALPIGKP